MSLPTEEQATKLTKSCIATKSFQLQSEYMGTRRIRVQVRNVPAYLTGDFLAAFLSAYGSAEEVSQLPAATGTAHGDYVFRVCLNREGFQVIPDPIISRDRQMMVVEGRRPHCWHCKQAGHLARVCPRKNPAASTTEPSKTITGATNPVHPAPETENAPSSVALSAEAVEYADCTSAEG